MFSYIRLTNLNSLECPIAIKFSDIIDFIVLNKLPQFQLNIHGGSRYINARVLLTSSAVSRWQLCGPSHIYKTDNGSQHFSVTIVV